MDKRYEIKDKYKIITQKLLREKFHYINGGLYWRKTFQGLRKDKILQPAGTRRQNLIRYVNIYHQDYTNAILVWIYHVGTIPTAIRWINGDVTDDRIENLKKVPFNKRYQKAVTSPMVLTLNKKSIYSLGIKNKTGTSYKYYMFYYIINNKRKAMYFNIMKYSLETVLRYKNKALELEKRGIVITKQILKDTFNEFENTDFQQTNQGNDLSLPQGGSPLFTT